jgi:hypothetical protein
MEHSALGTRGGLMTHRVQDGSWCSRRWLVPAIHMSTRTDFQRFAARTGGAVQTQCPSYIIC